MPNTTSRAVARLRVIDTSTGNYVLSVDGAIRTSKPSSGAAATPGKPVMKGQPRPMMDFVGIRFVKIPPGTFMMGSPENEPHRNGSERLHTVTLTQPFEMGISEVTQLQYQTVMGTNPSRFQGLQNPVENVSWDDAVQFCTRMTNHPRSKAAGYVYRLPTEAEWEYVCRAGKNTAYCFGDSPAQLGDYAWFIGNSGGKPHPVGQRKPNTWGLYDMRGNVLEWCQDYYGGYPRGSVTNPRGSSTGTLRVNRGGSAERDAAYLRSASRRGDMQSVRYSMLGFRVVRTSTQVKRA